MENEWDGEERWDEEERGENTKEERCLPSAEGREGGEIHCTFFNEFSWQGVFNTLTEIQNPEQRHYCMQSPQSAKTLLLHEGYIKQVHSCLKAACF